MEHLYYQNYDNGIPIPKPQGKLDLTPSAKHRKLPEIITFDDDDNLLELVENTIIRFSAQNAAENNLLEL